MAILKPIPLLLILLLTEASVSLAQSEPAKGFRWGVGWDNGIAMRYRFGEHWGVGLGLGGSFEHGDGSEGQIHSILMVFRNVQVASVLGLGPYLLLRPVHTSSHEGSEEITNGLAIELGLHPTFRFWRRLELATRFGAGILYNHATRREGPVNARETSRLNTWDVYTTGNNLGPAVVVQFMIYL